MAAVVGILGQELLGVTPAWYLHGEKVRVPIAVHMASLQSLLQLHQWYSQDMLCAQQSTLAGMYHKANAQSFVCMAIYCMSLCIVRQHLITCAASVCLRSAELGL